jgi:L-ascorbate metabolism protein UlaG (beta-lactamase superfamily)
MNLFTKTNNVTLNPDLKIIKNGWKGNPVNDDGSFRNINHPFINDFTKLLKWQLSKNPQSEERKKDKFRIPVVDAESFIIDNQDGIIWVGHATFLIRISGKLLITDPIFFQPSFFMKRFTKLPFDPKNLKNLDYILLTHDHYDHLDKESLKLIYKNNPKVKLLTGLNTGKYCSDFLDGIDYQEAGWYQQFSNTNDLEIIYLPTRHWGNRLITDVNSRLWGAFMIKNNSTSIYFGGDSGWDTHFQEVNELFGSPDFAMIGIGAYKPEWFMSPHHTSPKDGLRAAEAIQTKNLIPMHYGTFDLSDEPIGEPYREVHKLYDSNSYNFKLITPKIGQILKFDK